LLKRVPDRPGTVRMRREAPLGGRPSGEHRFSIALGAALGLD